MAETLDIAVRRICRFLAAAQLRGRRPFGFARCRPAIYVKPPLVRVRGGRCAACRASCVVGRYHSLHAVRSTLPPELSVTVETEDGVVMAVEHQYVPIAAVQLHPKSR